MEDNKTVAEMLREKPEDRRFECYVAKELLGTKCNELTCSTCHDRTANALADMIEAEQAEAVNASKSTPLPEGIEWPRFEDGELVKFGDVAKVREDIGEVIEIRFHTGKCSEVTIAFEGESTATHYMVIDGPHVKRPESEVLDADGVPIKVGDTVWYEDKAWRVTDVYVCSDGEGGVNLESFIKDGYDEPVEGVGNAWNKLITHRKPDTQDDLEADVEEWVNENLDGYPVEAFGAIKEFLRRQRKLLERE